MDELTARQIITTWEELQDENLFLCLNDCSEEDLAALPTNVKRLTISNSPKLHTIPKLPNSLLSLTLFACHNVTSIESLPPNLTSLRILTLGQLTGLPRLPRYLQSLELYCCSSIRTLHGLPPYLEDLSCMYGNFESIHLPKSLLSLELVHNNIGSLCEIPNTLLHFHIGVGTIPRQRYDERREQYYERLNLMYERERTLERVRTFGQELRLAAISPERVARWLGSDNENPRWDVLDMMMGID